MHATVKIDRMLAVADTILSSATGIASLPIYYPSMNIL
ncbi:hypothetical protein GJA_4104 [Janthinobacterium agaricidamnosum NBRC 102515 = DSM 9628]|uniref:Uncharacterized protein n=1 Tax=Janthinobacterium agaricidamnosum NBRC 102515 = DSM 9628 TaxID=1349767 RepID=W0V7A0_9BURK|nr:hypothetical protein GJA_4104 [Janthinobacterium agaricidamnosum NBRC 102515 = DSM 9628]